VFKRAKPALVLLALGCPKQELFMCAHREALAPAVLLGIGATLDFIAGTVRRAPRWASRVGLEWAVRLAQEPRRMARRYLVRDPAILGIAVEMLRMPREGALLSREGVSQPLLPGCPRAAPRRPSRDEDAALVCGR
jgi:UDP-N-acetyl-D-mannosaminuronic acid transferase (WecB/TagA/CpsF family)